MKVIQSKKGELEDHFKSLLSLTKKRQVVLDDSLSFYQLIQVWKKFFHYSIKITFLCFLKDCHHYSQGPEGLDQPAAEAQGSIG